MITRFAPSPTGPLHLGHAFSALTAWDLAQAMGGDFLLRIEDIDRARARPEWETAIYDDLHWLGLSWPKPVLHQSDRLAAYERVIADLWARELIYACTCSRRDIAAAASAPHEGAPPMGPDGVIYPGTCRANRSRSGTIDIPRNAALRLDMTAATAGLGPFVFDETGAGPGGETGSIRFTADEVTAQIGDIVLARRDMGTSYHLSVVLDDAAQNITHVVRGQDLFDATRIHVVLQRLLGLPTPVYHHHRLIRDDTGKRLAKRDDARAIAGYRKDGLAPAAIRKMVGL
ncbi:MAG: tRNA glutamyl-Q(34) synthetase GluQRS [Marinibacterium sp.]